MKKVSLITLILLFLAAILLSYISNFNIATIILTIAFALWFAIPIFYYDKGDEVNTAFSFIAGISVFAMILGTWSLIVNNNIPTFFECLFMSIIVISLAIVMRKKKMTLS